MVDKSIYVAVVENWWASFRPQSRSRGNIAGGPCNYRKLAVRFLTFDIESHKARGSDQLRNASLLNVQRILARFGEERTLLKEGGRTNRGLMRNLTPLFKELADAGLDQLSPHDRDIETHSHAEIPSR